MALPAYAAWILPPSTGLAGGLSRIGGLAAAALAGSVVLVWGGQFFQYQGIVLQVQDPCVWAVADVGLPLM